MDPRLVAALITVTAVVVVLASYRSLSGPERQRSELRRTLKARWSLEPYKTPLFTFVTESFVSACIEQIAQARHLENVENREETELKSFESELGTKGSWNPKLLDRFHRLLVGGMPSERASCVSDGLSRSASPCSLLYLVEGRNMPSRTALALALQLTFKHCPGLQAPKP